MSNLSIQALLLGILQGLTEFLPVSSSAHLILFPWLFHWHNPLVDSLTFDVALHAGTLLAILWYFWRDWVELIWGFFRILAHRRVEDSRERLIIYIILATIPAAVAGFLLEKMIEGSFRSPALIVLPLIVVSFLMIYVERRPHPSHPLDELGLKDALIIGCAQALALLPGVSRSGITITTGLFRGYGREAATRFSFLLSTPVIAGAALLHLGHLPKNMISEWPIFAIGLASSGIVGYLAIAFLIRFLRRHTLNGFAAYRLAVAGIIIFCIVWRG